MSDNGSSPISDLEQQFILEQKGEGSLSVFVADGADTTYVGFDINPEDIEALYFEGIGVPRWESLIADNIEQQTAMYWERFNERMDNYPLIGRARDTDERVAYSADEVPQLIKECDQVTAGTSDAKALRALQKLSLAANKASEKQAGLNLKPSQLPNL
jgi:hypothetical protein